MRKSERMIEVFLEGGGERIAVHPRKRGKNLYTTRDEHMPRRLNAVQHIRSPDYGNVLLEQAGEIGTECTCLGGESIRVKGLPRAGFHVRTGHDQACRKAWGQQD